MCVFYLFYPAMSLFSKDKDTTPMKMFAACSLTYLGAMLASNQSLQYISYPTQVIYVHCIYNVIIHVLLLYTVNEGTYICVTFWPSSFLTMPPFEEVGVYCFAHVGPLVGRSVRRSVCRQTLSNQ